MSGRIFLAFILFFTIFSDGAARAQNLALNDSLFNLSSQIIAPDGDDFDAFGTSVAIDGNTAVIGAWSDDIGGNDGQGSAYVFVKNAGGNWTFQAKLTASDGAVSDTFGASVGISGDTIIVGAPHDDLGLTGQDEGSAYVFVRSDATWTQQAKLTASDASINDYFGTSVAIENNTAVVGAIGSAFGGQQNEDNVGAVYVFARSGSNWIQQAKLLASDGALGDDFGASVAIGNGTIVAGSPGSDVGTILSTNVNQGAAYVFVNIGFIWTQQKKLTDTGGRAYDAAGASVAISGETVVVGATGDNLSDEVLRQGSAIIFARSGTNWTQRQKIFAADNHPYAGFGASVGISGGTIVVGSPQAYISPNQWQGAAYVFAESGYGVWTQQQKLFAAGGGEHDYFGNAVALSGLNLVSGAYQKDVSAAFSENAFPGQDQGAVYFYQTLAPTASEVSVGGRVRTADGRGIQNVSITLTKADGTTQTTKTSTFGYYKFDRIEAGQTVVVSVQAKRFSFAQPTLILNVSEDLTDADFVALE